MKNNDGPERKGSKVKMQQKTKTKTDLIETQKFFGRHAAAITLLHIFPLFLFPFSFLLVVLLGRLLHKVEHLITIRTRVDYQLISLTHSTVDSTTIIITTHY